VPHDLTWARTPTGRDFEQLENVTGLALTFELISRCYGISVDAAKDLPAPELNRCQAEIMERLGLA
jgi:hypothetical protein